MKLRSLMAALAALYVTAAAPASAATLLDTVTDPFTLGGYTVSNPVSGGGQSIAVPFSSGTSTVITAIEAYLTASGNPNQINLGIMADSSGLPSGPFLYSTLVSPDNVNPVSLASLSWGVTPGTTYWLAAIAAPGTTGGSWNYSNSLIGNFAFTSGHAGPPWSFNTFQGTPEARIFGELAAAAPEPSTWAMLILGFAGIGFMIHRQKSRAAFNAA